MWLFILGNLTAAIDVSFLRSNKINYIITVDSCPLPEIILDLRDIHIKYIQGNFLKFYTYPNNKKVINFIVALI